MMYMRSLILFLLGVLPYGMVEAQIKSLNLRHITSEQGISDNQVTCILRDPLGFMWIGTKDGLNRYDGKEFYVFKNNFL